MQLACWPQSSGCFPATWQATSEFYHHFAHMPGFHFTALVSVHVWPAGAALHVLILGWTLSHAPWATFFENFDGLLVPCTACRATTDAALRMLQSELAAAKQSAAVAERERRGAQKQLVAGVLLGRLEVGGVPGVCVDTLLLRR